MVKRFVYVDGVARCGKNMLSPIVASLRHAEIQRAEAVFDWVGIMQGLGRIEKDAATALMRMHGDLYLYDAQLLRNINLRWQDQSSVFRNPNTVPHLLRLFHKEGDGVVDRLIRKRPIYQNMTHHQMEFADFHFDTYPDELRIIELLRDPVDLVEAWWRKGNGSRLGTSLKDIGVCIEYGDQTVHYLVRGWEKDYFRMEPLDRVIRMLHGLQMRTRKGYEGLLQKRRNKVLWLKFERFVENPFEHAARIADFLDTETTRHTRRAIKRQHLPLNIPDERWHTRYQWIKETCHASSLPLIDEMIADYRLDWS